MVAGRVSQRLRGRRERHLDAPLDVACGGAVHSHSQSSLMLSRGLALSQCLPRPVKDMEQHQAIEDAYFVQPVCMVRIGKRRLGLNRLAYFHIPCFQMQGIVQAPRLYRSCQMTPCVRFS